jgi:multidrug efflux system outer membrane protein
MNRFTTVLLASTVLVACTTLHPVDTPQTDPANLPAMTVPVPQHLDRWWQGFADPELDALVEEALAHNLDLREAHARLEESRARLRLARADRLPGLDLAISSNRSRTTTVGDNPLPPGFSAATSDHRVALDLSWEIDVWGRVAATEHEAGAAYQASLADLAGARASLAAGVVRAWFQLRAIDAELALADRILQSREQSLQLIGQRHRAGASGKLELAQARAERDTARAALPPLRQSRAQAESALAVLLGRTPKDIFDPAIVRGKPLENLASAPAVPAGLDAGLLARRPDVIAAAARVQAKGWQLQAARAALFPRITLTGLLGYESGALADLVSAPARIGQIALGALQPVSGIASLGAARDVAAAQLDQGTLAWQAAVRNAFRETHDALVDIRETGSLVSAQRDRVDSLAESLRLAQLRFDAGYSGYLEVLDSERGHDAAAMALLQAQRDHLLAMVDLYLALGGGWSGPELDQPPGGTFDGTAVSQAASRPADNGPVTP